MHIVHLTASTFFGGPERQMLGLADHLSASYRTSFVSFSEQGRNEAFLNVLEQKNHHAIALRHDFPSVWKTLDELKTTLRALRADVLLTHSYKPNILGRIAAHALKIPVVAVSRGWTGENRRVRMYERLDRWNLRFVDHVVAVSEGQAAKVRSCGVCEKKLSVIRNSCRLDAFVQPDPHFELRLQSYFAADLAISDIVISAGRLSPEKGFDVLVRAAKLVLKSRPQAAFIHFGDGVQREKIEQLIRENDLEDRFILAGFTSELDHFLPFAQLVVLPSYTEGLPNVALEAGAAGVPIVATRVGGTPEVVRDQFNGLLVSPGHPQEMADAIVTLLKSEGLRRKFGKAGRDLMEAEFSFQSQARSYENLFTALTSSPVLVHPSVICTQLTNPICATTQFDPDSLDQSESVSSSTT